MPHPHEGNVNLVPTDVLDSGYPFAALGPNIAQSLAQTQFQGMTSADIARIQAQASTFGASTSAAATIGAAGIGAQSRVDAQLIATNGAIAQNNAQMKTDAALAAAGDIAAYRRLLQEQQYDAQLQNNANKMEIAKLAGSGSLFDNIAARYASAGQGALPQIGGAFGLAGGIQNVSAPTGNAPTSIQELMALIPQAQLQSGSGTNFMQGFSLPSAPSFSGSSGGGDIGSLFGSTLQSVFDAIQATQGDLITAVDPTATSSIPAQTASNFTFDITGDPTQSAANTDAANAFLLANQSQFLHGGGEIKKGESAIVGDDRGRLTPFSELIKVTDKGVKVTPLNKFRGAFHTGTAEHEHSGKLKAGFNTTDFFGALNAGGGPGTTTGLIGALGTLDLGSFSSPTTPPVAPPVTPPVAPPIIPPVTPPVVPPAAPPIIPPVVPPPVTPPTTPPPAAPPADPLGADKVLSDINKLPALEALRGNPSQSIFDFGFKFERPELGISELPSPFAAGRNFLTMPFSQKNDVLQAYKSFFGVEQGDFLNMFQQSQPGFRNFPRNAFAF